MANNLKNFVLECLFPSGIECIVCGDELGHKHLGDMCGDCLERLPKIIKECKKCGVSITGSGKYCLSCKDRKFKFKKGIACFDYSGDIVELVHKLKYGGAKFLAAPLATFMIEKLKESGISADLIVPVPVSLKRLKERGYNQAALLAKEISESVKIQYAEVLERVKDTPAQASLTQQERRENLKGAFVVADKTKVSGKTLLIIDDIMTTGATCNEITEVLLKAKAKEVFVLTLAHTVLRVQSEVNT